MLWMVMAELIPDARSSAPARVVALTVAVSLAAMVAFQELVL